MKFFFVIFLFISVQSFSQKNFSPGYIVKENGDTLRGYLQEEDRKDLFNQVNFKTDLNSSSSQSFSPSEAKSFQYKTGGLYKSIRFRNIATDSPFVEQCFAIQLVEGAYNLFSFLVGDQTFYVVIKDEEATMLFDNQYYVNGDLKLQSNYITELTLLDSACENKILNLDRVKYNEFDIANAVIALNKCVAPNVASKNNYKKPTIKTQFIIFAGGLPLKRFYEYSGEGLLKITTSQFKKFSINIGFHYFATEKVYQNIYYGSGSLAYQYLTTYSDFSIPLTFQFNILTGPIRPYVVVGMGADFIKQNYSSTSPIYYNATLVPSNTFEPSGILGIGLEGYITPWFLLKAEWRYQYVLQYPAIGLAFLIK